MSKSKSITLRCSNRVPNTVLRTFAESDNLVHVAMATEILETRDSRPTRRELATALFDVLDGVKKHEVTEMTGLREDDVDRIWTVLEKARRLLGHT